MGDYLNPFKLFMKKLLYPFVFSFLFMLPLISVGQERQDNAWKALFTDYSLTTSTTLRLETHLRTRRFFAENDQYLVRPSISFKLSQNTAFTAGVTYLSSNTPVDRTLENNIWQQFNFSIPIKRSRYFGWIRLEQRWQKKGDTSNYGARLRFRTGFQFPLLKKEGAFFPKLVVFNEVFMTIQDGFPYRFNQNWTFFGFQQRFSKQLQLLTGFQRNTIAKENTFLHKNIWSSILFYKL